MKDYLLTRDTKQRFYQDLDYELEQTPRLLVTTSKEDNSLKARQRKLAQCWYKEIADHLGESIGYAIAHCKLRWGLRIATLNNAELEQIVRRMLDGYTYEDKLRIIDEYSEWFPILRAKGGLSAEDTGRYLSCIQIGFAKEGLVLTSPNEDNLLNCREANR